eukprot:7148564-Pyramimonas_sp.AAC.1
MQISFGSLPAAALPRSPTCTSASTASWTRPPWRRLRSLSGSSSGLIAREGVLSGGLWGRIWGQRVLQGQLGLGGASWPERACVWSSCRCPMGGSVSTSLLSSPPQPSV